MNKKVFKSIIPMGHMELDDLIYEHLKKQGRKHTINSLYKELKKRYPKMNLTYYMVLISVQRLNAKKLIVFEEYDSVKVIYA